MVLEKQGGEGQRVGLVLGPQHWAHQGLVSLRFGKPWRVLGRVCGKRVLFSKMTIAAWTAGVRGGRQGQRPWQCRWASEGSDGPGSPVWVTQSQLVLSMPGLVVLFTESHGWSGAARVRRGGWRVLLAQTARGRAVGVCDAATPGRGRGDRAQPRDQERSSHHSRKVTREEMAS